MLSSSRATGTARPQCTILYGLSALCIFDWQLPASQKGPGSSIFYFDLICFSSLLHLYVIYISCLLHLCFIYYSLLLDRLRNTIDWDHHLKSIKCLLDIDHLKNGWGTEHLCGCGITDLFVLITKQYPLNVTILLKTAFWQTSIQSQSVVKAM